MDISRVLDIVRSSGNWQKFPSRIEVAEILLTPELAREFLGLNQENRTVVKANVSKMADDWKLGRYAQTHQGIAFSADGSMVDGQHRCWATAESGVAIRILVFVGLSDEAKGVIDLGRPRSPVHALKLQYGVTVSTAEIAVAQSMMQVGRYGGGLPVQAVVSFFREHDSAIRFAYGAVTPKSGLGIAPVRSAVAKAWYTVDHEELLRFCDLLNHGFASPPQDRDGTVVLLKDKLKQLKVGGTADVKAGEMHRKTAGALRAYLDRKLLRKINDPARIIETTDGRQIAYYNDLFPIPDEV